MIQPYITIEDIVRLCEEGNKYKFISIFCTKYRNGLSLDIKRIGEIDPKMLDFEVIALQPDTAENELRIIVDSSDFTELNKLI